MATVAFTPHLGRHVACPTRTAAGETVRAVLENVFREQPELRSYLLDDQGRLRPHIMVFVDGTAVSDRIGLSDPAEPSAEIYVLQALSGG